MKRRHLILVFLLAALSWPAASAAPTFNGATGGFFAPQALVVPANRFNLGVNAIFPVPGGSFSLHGAFGVGGVAEIGLGAYHLDRYGVFAKFILLAMAEGQPGIAVGGDLRFGGNALGGNAYLVITLPIRAANLLITGGIQTNFGPEGGAAGIAIGPVLGVEWVVSDAVRMILDYDSRNLGAGLRLTPVAPLRIDVGLAALGVREVGVFIGISLNATF